MLGKVSMEILFGVQGWNTNINKLQNIILLYSRFNATNADAVINTHLDFLRAGSEAILTNTYQASVEGYAEYLNFNDDESIKLIEDTVKLAHVARARFLKEEGLKKSAISIPWIVGSIVS